MAEIKEHGSVDMPSLHGSFKLMAYSAKADDPMPHLVMMTQGLDRKMPVNVRVHSECITGDLFGSLRCECGTQFNESLKYIDKHQGLLIYLRQEGRGIGIINKIKAYVEQDKGYDTSEANLRLGFEADARKYDAAIQILQSLGIEKINLLTNNPDKMEAFKGTGIEVVQRIPLEIPPHPHNEAYLKAKKTVFGHFLEAV